jgi:hypothetical protein
LFNSVTCKRHDANSPEMRHGRLIFKTGTVQQYQLIDNYNCGSHVGCGDGGYNCTVQKLVPQYYIHIYIYISRSISGTVTLHVTTIRSQCHDL